MRFLFWLYMWRLYDLPFYSQGIKTINFKAVHFTNLSLYECFLFCLINMSIYKNQEGLLHYPLEDYFVLHGSLYNLLILICIGTCFSYIHLPSTRYGKKSHISLFQDLHDKPSALISAGKFLDFILFHWSICLPLDQHLTKLLIFIINLNTNRLSSSSIFQGWLRCSLPLNFHVTFGLSISTHKHTPTNKSLLRFWLGSHWIYSLIWIKISL